MSEHEFTFEKSVAKYWMYPAKNPDAPTIIAIHGFRGTHHGLEKVISEAPEFNFIVPDLPGFGASEPFAWRTHNADNYAEFTTKFIEYLNIKNPIILGHSFGTIVAAKMEEKFPKLSQRVILIAPISRRARDNASTKVGDFYYWVGRKLPERTGAKLLSSKTITRGMSVGMMKTRDPALRKYIHAQHLTHFSEFASRDQLIESYESSSSDEVRDIIANIRKPLLIIAGDQDIISKLSENEKLVAKFADKSSQLVVIPNTGHLLHYEKPAEIAGAVRHFLISES